MKKVMDWVCERFDIPENHPTKPDRTDLVGGLVVGLVVGLVWGLVWGLVGGLVWGLVGGLVVGLVGGLVVGLVVGLVWGLVVGLVWGLGSLAGLGVIAFFKEAPHLWLFLLALVIIAEVIFWLFDTAQPEKKESRFWFTLKRKVRALLIALGIGVEGVGQYNLARELLPSVRVHWPTILRWIGYIGAGLLVVAAAVGVFALFVWLNSLKYGRKGR